WQALASVMSTEPKCEVSGYFSASASSSGVTVRANAATFRPCSSRSVTIASPSPRDAPEISTTSAGGTSAESSARFWGVLSVSDIALQRLLRRDLVEEAEPARDAVLRKPVTGKGGQRLLVQSVAGGEYE